MAKVQRCNLKTILILNLHIGLHLIQTQRYRDKKTGFEHEKHKRYETFCLFREFRVHISKIKSKGKCLAAKKIAQWHKIATA